MNMNLPILMYHDVVDASSPAGDLEVTLGAFTLQMKELVRQGLKAITLSELAAVLQTRGLRPLKSCVVITFDDAYQSVRTAALPVMAGLGLRGVVFAVEQAVGKSNVWDDGKGIPSRSCLNQADLVELMRLGWEIGSHGLTHRNLTQCVSEELQEELQGSRIALTQRLGKPVMSLAYPYGAWNSETRAAAIAAGYATACAIAPATPSVLADPWALRRVYVKGSDSLMDFKRKISWWYLKVRAWQKH
jgi:peptidoglycan/xylan/chitin deacetylase (PgdA/CDA1 family)